jgi:hypothetical protein
MMQVALVDKSNRFYPHNLNSVLIARFEVELNNDAELMALLKHINGLDINTLMGYSSDQLGGDSSFGVHPPSIPPKLHLKIEKKVEEEKAPPPVDPISSLEVE